MRLEEWVLERLDGMALIRQFAQLDVLVAVHGAGITNIIFMMPNSFVVELFPPFWQYGCYRRLASNVGVLYAKETAIGEKGPECARDETSTLCLYAGIRDRHFSMNSTVVRNRVAAAIVAVWKSKYGVRFSFVCSDWRFPLSEPVRPIKRALLEPSLLLTESHSFFQFNFNHEQDIYRRIGWY